MLWQIGAEWNVKKAVLELSDVEIDINLQIFKFFLLFVILVVYICYEIFVFQQSTKTQKIWN